MKAMNLMDSVSEHLSTIKTIKGVENAVLTQRDGNPLKSVGVWLSQDEIFKVSAANSAIYNCGLELHPGDLKYILIEGTRAKILLAPLKNSDNEALDRIVQAQGIQGGDDEFYIAITTIPTINLGGIFLKTRDATIEIKKALVMSGESFKPPLRKYTKQEMEELTNSFNLKENVESSSSLNFNSVFIDEETSFELEKTMDTLSVKIDDLNRAYLTIEGGFIVSQIQKNNFINQSKLESQATMSYSLLSTADQCSWFLKKMQVTSILLECKDSFQFINRVGSGILSIDINKGSQKLGLLRMILPKFMKKFDEILSLALIKTKEKPMLDMKEIFSQIILQ
jgi:predicted regulator of Ras-like GTPase activity (Roadblock/LC7/MglB family)